MGRINFVSLYQSSSHQENLLAMLYNTWEQMLTSVKGWSGYILVSAVDTTHPPLALHRGTKAPISSPKHTDQKHGEELSLRPGDAHQAQHRQSRRGIAQEGAQPQLHNEQPL